LAIKMGSSRLGVYSKKKNKSSGHRLPSLLPLSFHSKRPNKKPGAKGFGFNSGLT